MRITYALTLDDGLAFARYQRKQPYIRRRLLLQNMIYAGIGAVSTIVFFFLFSKGSSFTLRSFVILSVGILLVMVVALLFSLALSILSMQHAVKKSFEGKRIADPIELCLSDEGVQVISKIGTYLTKWSAIQCVAETVDHVFIYYNENVAVIIPKRIFADPEQGREFVQRAEQCFQMSHLQTT